MYPNPVSDGVGWFEFYWETTLVFRSSKSLNSFVYNHPKRLLALIVTAPRVCRAPKALFLLEMSEPALGF